MLRHASVRTLAFHARILLAKMMPIQNAPDSLTRWFFTNAPAAWISAVVAISTLVYVLSSRKKASRIVVRETRNTTLVTIWPSVRENIELLYLGHKIDTLAQIDLDIFNQGSEVIHRPSLAVALPSGSRVLGTRLIPEDDGAYRQVEGAKVTLILPYINPVAQHEHIWTLSILADGDTERITISGGGEGWSVQHSPLPTSEQLRGRRTVLTMAGACAVSFSFAFGWYMETRYGIRFFEVSWRAFFTGALGSLPLFLVGVSAYRLLGVRVRVE
jgi:hypothetical protein